MNVHIHEMTKTQREAVERRRAFHASIAAKAAELADRKTRLRLAAIPVAAIEAPLISVPAVNVVSQDKVIESSQPDWFVVLPPGEGQPLIRDIQKTVCTYYKVTLADMFSRRRTADIVKPRQVAMFLCKELTHHSFPQIARKFGGRDHTTALHAIRKIPVDAYRCADLAQDIVILREKLTGSPL